MFRATEGLSVAAIGFPLIAFVFYLWRPQSKKQLIFGITASTLLFVGPLFQPRLESPLDYVTELYFRVDCSIVGCCMILSQILPATIAYFTMFRLVNRRQTDRRNGSIQRGVSIWELLFFTLCCAICVSLITSVNQELASKSPGTVWYFRTQGSEPLSMCVSTCLIVPIGLHFRSSSAFRTALWMGLCGMILFGVLLIGSHFERYDALIDIPGEYDFKRIVSRAIAMFVVIAISTLTFVFLLRRMGYGFVPSDGREPTDAPESASGGY